MSLEGRVAVVTGGGRGIGRAIAQRLAADGATVVVSSRTSADLDAVVEGIESNGGRAVAVVANAMDRDDAKRPVHHAIERFGRADIVINNVGGTVMREHDPFTGSDESFEKTLVLSLTSAWWTSRAALPEMRAAGWGRIINIGSGASRSSTPGGAIAYTTAKHGLVGFTRQLARNVATHGITVNCVCPGWTNTSMVDWEAIARRSGVTIDEAQKDAKASSAQNRILEPEELTGLVSLLCGEGGRGITGQIIGVDGGYGI